MKLTSIITDENAVSPVIGVILMVAITVILAAVIGTFVLGFGQDLQQTPQASFTFDEPDASADLTVTHNGGDSIPGAQLYARGSGITNTDWSGVAADITAGDSLTLSDPTNDTQVRIAWERGEESATLAKYTTVS